MMDFFVFDLWGLFYFLNGPDYLLVRLVIFFFFFFDRGLS